MDRTEVFKGIEEALVKLRNTEESDYLTSKIEFLDYCFKILGIDFETYNAEQNRLAKELEEISDKEKKYL